MPRGDVTVRYYHTYPATHLIWLIVTGSWPTGVVDHRDTNPSNNKWDNLRDATRPQNGYNRKRYKTNTSGYKGVHWDKRWRKWRATIGVDGHKIFLGYFPSPEEASEAYNRAAVIHHGDFSNLNAAIK